MDNLNGKDVSVISGQIFRNDDPIATYINKKTGLRNKLQIPLKFWKVVYYIHNNVLKRIAFVIRQDKQVYKLPFIKRVGLKRSEVLKADPFDTLPKSLKIYIVNLSLIEDATNLKFSNGKDYLQGEKHLINEPIKRERNFIELSTVNILDYL